MEKEYLEKVIRPYGDKFTSLDYNNTNFKVGVFYDDFDTDDEKSVVFQVYDVEKAHNTYFDVGEDNELSYYNDYEMLDLESQILVTVSDLLNDKVDNFYQEVVF